MHFNSASRAHGRIMVYLDRNNDLYDHCDVLGYPAACRRDARKPNLHVRLRALDMSFEQSPLTYHQPQQPAVASSKPFSSHLHPDGRSCRVPGPRSQVRRHQTGRWVILRRDAPRLVGLTMTPLVRQF